jgi:hypothetical protein
LRSGEEQAHVEARLGAVVPRSELPEEPALAELPADPVAAGEIASPSMEPGDSAIEPADARGFARPDAPEASVLDNDEQQDWPPADGAGRRHR